MIKKFFINNPIHKKIAPIFDFLFLVRPTLFFSIWVMVAIGMFLASKRYIEYMIWYIDFDCYTLLLYGAITFVCSATFILNQIVDIEGDQVNNKLFLVGKKLSIIECRNISHILIFLGLAISLFVDWFVSLLLILLYVLWGYLYNEQPFVLKRSPILGWLINTFAGIVLIFIGWAYTHKQFNSFASIFNFDFIQYSIPYILSFSAISLLTTIPDMKGDHATNVKTFPIVFGKITTIIISTLLMLPAQFISIINNDPLASTAIIVSFPFFIFAVIRQMDKDIIRAIRYPIFILNIFVMGIYPWLFIPVIIVFYLSKYYYWHRFDLHYPTLLVDHD